MARFDEFKESLRDADLHLEGAIRRLNDKSFDNDEEHYCEIYNNLIHAQEELEDALQDLADNVGISCDEDCLKACLAELEVISCRIDSEVEGRHTASNYFYTRAIKALQRDIEQIAHGAR